MKVVLSAALSVPSAEKFLRKFFTMNAAMLAELKKKNSGESVDEAPAGGSIAERMRALSTASGAGTRSRQASAAQLTSQRSLLQGDAMSTAPAHAGSPVLARPTAAAAGKRLVKMGWLHKQGGASGSLFSRESWKRRWVVLEEKRLMWHEGEGALPKGEVRVLGAQIDPSPPEVAKRPHAFAIRHPDRTLFAAAENADEHKAWVRALTAAAGGNASAVLERGPSALNVDGGDRSRDSQVGVGSLAPPKKTASSLPAGVRRPTSNSIEAHSRATAQESDRSTGEWWQDKLTRKTGFLLKQGGHKGGTKNWRKRYAVLQGGELQYFKDDSLRGIVRVRGARVDEAPPECKGRAHAFAVRHPDREFFAAAESAAELTAWLAALRECALSSATGSSVASVGSPARRNYEDSDDDGGDGDATAAPSFKPGGGGVAAKAPVGLGALIGGGRPPPVGGRPGYGAPPTPTANTAVPAEAVPEVTEHANLERAKPSPKRRPPTKKPRAPAAAE